MLAWAFEWLMWLGWYGLLVGGWWAWWCARQRAARLDRELTMLAHAFRHRAGKETTPYG